MMRSITTMVKALKVFLFLAAITLVLLVSMKTFMSWKSEGKPKAGGGDDDVVLNELLLNPSTVGWPDGFIELYNKGDKPVDLKGWRIYTTKSSTELSNTIKPKGFLAYYSGIADEYSSEIFMKNGEGKTIDTYTYELRPDGVSVGRSPDGGSTWVGFETPTPGASNVPVVGASTTVPECMVDEYQLIEDDVAASGFTGGSYQFCSAFKREVTALDVLTRKRVSELDDAAVKSAIVREVAERDVARRREERVLTLTVSDSTLLDSLTGFLGSELISLGFDSEIAAMNDKFRGMFYDIITNGSLGEKTELKLQLKYYLEGREKGGIRLPKFNPDEVRLMLVDGRPTDEIILELSR
jgi:hypothetical protein